MPKVVALLGSLTGPLPAKSATAVRMWIVRRFASRKSTARSRRRLLEIGHEREVPGEPVQPCDEELGTVNATRGKDLGELRPILAHRGKPSVTI